ncbi:galactose oxidase [Gigaspora margarita]|uniref:Galactose oxidase n=1 Tax=Gigaspora margarita TaxID=4874 RepID=A0A8H3XHY6_GIGMA|nr:galactose oxidase [Gigaspora margarita]
MLLLNFYIFTFLLNFIFTFAGFMPNGRVYHSSVLLDNKLYFSGGHNESYDNITNEFFYLDVSKPFTTTDNDSMRFDNGLIAMFSGISSSSNSTNNLWIFNTLTLTWSLSNATNAPLPMYTYCAVTLPDGNILYIGGSYFTNSPATGPVSMGDLPLYNTTSDTWTSKSTGGTFPPPRLQFSAVLSFSFSNVTSDGRIVIFGGYSLGNVFDGSFSLDVFSDLWILNTQALFEWSIGIISNPIVDLALYGHTATLVDNYMFVSFGKFQNGTHLPKIFILDVSQKDSYKWVTEFDANTKTTTTNITTITTANTLTTNFLAGIIVGSIISFIIFVSAIFYFLKKWAIYFV